MYSLPLGRGTPPRGLLVLALVVALVACVALLWAGLFFIVQQSTGPKATATVGDCEVTGAGRYQETRCTGTWIVGGSLLENGHVVYGSVEGVDPSQVGTDVPVTVHGDTAYAREPILPSVLIGFGVVWIGIALLLIRALVRGRPRRPA